MRMSCNGCRVLRKGCSDNCSIRPCLHWIKSPDSQAHATVFLAKFYGRAGLMNLINAGPDHLRPAIFRSLLYEACGRIVNPIYGSMGLLWSGQWQLCQNAVEAVLKGAPITPISSEAAATSAPPPPPPPSSAKAYDIRHVTKDQSSNCNSHFPDLHRTRFKRSRVAKPTSKASSAHKAAAAAAFSKTISPATPDELTRNVDAAELNGSSTSHDSSVSHPVDEVATDTSNLSVETAEADVEERHNGCDGDGDGELELDLTLGFGLGFEPVQRSQSSQPKSCTSSRAADDGACRIQLGLF